jgi:hypothetical protein
MGWAEYVVPMEEKKIRCRILMGRREEKRPPGRLDVHETAVLKWI